MTQAAEQPAQQPDGGGPNRAQQVTREIHDRLRRDILSGALPAGQPISQVQLAAKLGVSRTPLREALRLLEREGLVEAEHNKQVRVARSSIEDLEQVYAMRITLEALAVRFSLPAMTSDDIEAMAEAHEKMRLYADRRDYERWELPHREFHSKLLERSGILLRRTLSQLSDHVERYRYIASTQAPMAWPNSITDHQAILTATRAGDVAAVVEAVGRHYARVALNAVTLAAPEHDPRQVREALRLVLGRSSEHVP
jgi:DNA-binding GntR family transcriptional regulator